MVGKLNFPEMKEYFIKAYFEGLLPVLKKHEKKLWKKKVKLKVITGKKKKGKSGARKRK
jgi:hypothetical protein